MLVLVLPVLLGIRLVDHEELEVLDEDGRYQLELLSDFEADADEDQDLGLDELSEDQGAYDEDRATELLE